ncbi:nucleoside deaminase [Clostridium guangxiense]|uniref:nucleoside deaminase n=1 Tax=Clostridium guangxiense TaxID=1662055 RepID=UPI001E5D845E|nr:nucleoside deaminase [Clostridium guangxiense]MCD2346773.1 nucleoside deaminase [Clostridium guangxiense]
MENNFLDLAIKEAEKAAVKGEVPVGAVIVKDNKIIGRAHNMKETLKDVTAHAEVFAIREASKKLNNWRLNGCEMYVTLEPCAMCAATICQSRISKIYIGTFDPEAGACGSVINLLQSGRLGYSVNVKWLYSEKCSELLKDFFKYRRIKNMMGAKKWK